MWYLNNTAKEWDALVEGDYESVLPLIWKEKKFPKSRIFYQPDLIREIGPYSIHALSKKRIRSFFEAIPQEYRQVNIQISEQISPPTENGFEIIENYNHQLLLTETYEQIADKYSANFLRLLEKAQQARLRPNGNIKPEKIAEFYKKNVPKKLYKEANFHAYLRIMYNALHRGWGFATSMEDAQQKTLAVSFFVFSHGKMMSLLSLESPEGENLGALAFAYDLIIRNNAGRPLILDFNSSNGMIKSSFYKDINAKENIFYQLKKRYTGLEKNILGGKRVFYLR